MPYRVFVVEDHPVMREAYALLLAREADLELCGAAGSAEEALAAFDAPSDGLACDLVVADVSLPGMDGIELVGRLLARRPGLAALVVSGYEEEVYARRAREAGARAFLTKRGLERTLTPAIRAALGHGEAVGGGAPSRPDGAAEQRGGARTPLHPSPRSAPP